MSENLIDNKITYNEMQEFLSDFEQSAIVELIEESSKEKNEIYEIALARGINLKESKDISAFSCTYCFADIQNKNKTRLPKKALLKALPTLVGKPISADHIRNVVIGVLIDSRFIVRDNSVKAYGILFKSSFPEKWEEIEKKFKNSKVSVSYEIFCPKNKRKLLPDGTVELQEQIIAGMGILFKEPPAFDKAKILELAKEIKTSEELVYASIKCEDLIINGETKCQNCGKCKHIEVAEEKKTDYCSCPDAKFMIGDHMCLKCGKQSDPAKRAVAPITPAPIVIPKIKCQGCNTELDYTSIKEKGMGYIECPICKKNIDQTGKVLISKIKCANCQYEFDAPKVATSEMKCTECFAIINDKGDLLYPPQIIDFNISCPSCSSRNWRLLKKEEASAELKCLSCAKKYAITFSKVEPNAILNMIQFLRIGHVSCKQCGHYIGYSGTSQSTIYNLKCIKCGLAFTHDVIKDGQIKQLSKIEEIIEPIKASVSIDELNEKPIFITLPSGEYECAEYLHGEKKWVRNGKTSFSEEQKGYIFDETKEHKIIRCGVDGYYFIKKEYKCSSCGEINGHKDETCPKIMRECEPEIPSKADELNIDKSAIKEEAKGESKMEQIPVENIVEVASTPDAKSEVAEVKPEVAEAPVVAKEEAPKVEETPKVEEAKVEVKIEETIEAKVEEPVVEAKVEEPKPEVAPIVEATIETPKVEEVPVEAKEEIIDADEYEETYEVAKKLTYEQRKGLSDDDFAVVIEKEGKKIRKFPIHDEAHVRNALARLAQEAVKETLKGLGVSIEEVKNKILRRAKKLGMTQLLERYKATVKKLAKKIKDAKKEKASIIKSMEEKIEFYKANAEEINKRRKELGDSAKTLSDEELLDNTKFSDAKLVQANLETSSIVGTKKTDEDTISKYRDEIREKAEGRIKRTK